MTNQSDTPRTDAEECWHVYEDGFHSIEKVDEKHKGMGSHVPIKFARQLERELTAHMQEVERLKLSESQWEVDARTIANTYKQTAENCNQLSAQVKVLRELVDDFDFYTFHRADCHIQNTEFCTCGLKELNAKVKTALSSTPSSALTELVELRRKAKAFERLERKHLEEFKHTKQMIYTPLLERVEAAMEKDAK